MPDLPKMKEICPKCGKKVHYLRKHMKRNHGITPMVEKWNNPETPTTQETAQEIAMLERNPELDTLSKKVAEEEAKFGITPNPLPQSQNNPSPATVSESEEEMAFVPQTDTIFDPEATNYIVSTIFNTMATLTKEKEWALDKEELEILGPPLNRVVNKHAPDFMKKYQDEVVLGTVLISMFITKMQRIEMKKQANHGGNKDGERNEERRNAGESSGASRKAPKPDDLKLFLE